MSTVDDTITSSQCSALHEASVHWTLSLTEAARTINFAASDLQDDWADMSETLQAQGEPALPDPIKLLRRIHALENSVRNLQQDCHVMMERRQMAVLQAMDRLGILREMCQNKPFSEISMPVEPQRAHLRVQELEDVVSREYKRFQDKERNE